MWTEKWKPKGDIQPPGYNHFRSLCSYLFRHLSMPDFSDFPRDQRKESPFVTGAPSSLPDTVLFPPNIIVNYVIKKEKCSERKYVEVLPKRF